MTGHSGLFWFFDAANIELVVKVLDGRPLTGHWWVFYAALSNLGFELTVTDTASGFAKSYSNPLGRFASEGDVEAIPGG